MPNAKDAGEFKPAPRILVLADTGGGKTTQFLTLPGKKFAYLFDPNSLLSLKGCDVDYEEFFPESLSMSLTSISKQAREREAAKHRPKKSGREIYEQWEKDAEDKISSGFFNDYDWIMLDSFTTFSDLVMDGVLAVNGRSGQFPQQDDYPAQMVTLTNVIRTFNGLGKGIYMPGHMELKKDELSGRIYREPVMTGRLKVKLPLLFSEIFVLDAQADPRKGEVSYQCQTKKDRQNPLIRTSAKGLDFVEDVTLDFNKKLEEQGLGAMLTRGGVL